MLLEVLVDSPLPIQLAAMATLLRPTQPLQIKLGQHNVLRVPNTAIS